MEAPAAWINVNATARRRSVKGDPDVASGGEGLERFFVELQS